MVKRLSSTALAVLLVLWGRQGAAAARPVDEEYSVCRAFLDSSYAEKPNDLLYEKLGIFFIYNVHYDTPGQLGDFFKARAGVALDPDLLSNFVAINHSPKRLDPKRFPGSIHLQPQFIHKDVYSLSRVGFNARHDKALLYASYASLMEDGHGSLFYLEKANGTWSVVKAAAVWMYGASVHPFNP
jgi:hypothetical protein